jgi:regulatory protein
MTDAQPASAARAALSLLAKRSYSSSMLYEKLLEKGYEEPQAQAAVELMHEEGYINDYEYAERLAGTLQARGYGQRRIAQAMRAKGLEDYIDEITLPQDDSEALTGALQKLAGKGKDPGAIHAALARRGFDYGDLRRALAGARDE